MNADNSTALAERKVDRQIADTIAVGKGGITFDNAAQAMEYSKLMAASGSAVPKHLRGQPGACLGIVSDALRMGVNPYALARKSYFVNDQLAYEAQVFMAIINVASVLKSRPDLAFEGEGLERRCIVTATFREDGKERLYKSPRIHDIQPRNSPLWKSDPDQQLSYYSLRAFARRWLPEVVMGFVDVDELREAAMTDVTPKAAPDDAPVEAPKHSISRMLDDFAAEEDNRDPADEPAGFSTEQPSSGAEGSSADPPAPADAGAAATITTVQAINQVLAVAGADKPSEVRIDELEFLAASINDSLDPAFVRELVKTAIKVINGEIKVPAARKYLESL